MWGGGSYNYVQHPRLLLEATCLLLIVSLAIRDEYLVLASIAAELSRVKGPL